MFGVLLHCSDITMMQKILLVGISWRGGELEWWGVRGRALFEEMDYVEVAPSQIIMCQVNIFRNQYMYVLGNLYLSNHFGATIAGPCRSHFPIRMLILSYQ